MQRRPLFIIPPDHPPHHTDLHEPPYAYLPALHGARQQDFHVKLPALAPLTPHVALHVPERNVPHELGEVARQIVARDVAVQAPDADELPDIVGTA